MAISNGKNQYSIFICIAEQLCSPHRVNTLDSNYFFVTTLKLLHYIILVVGNCREIYKTENEIENIKFCSWAEFLNGSAEMPQKQQKIGISYIQLEGKTGACCGKQPNAPGNGRAEPVILFPPCQPKDYNPFPSLCLMQLIQPIHVFWNSPCKPSKAFGNLHQKALK